jgi:hypothetical protein
LAIFLGGKKKEGEYCERIFHFEFNLKKISHQRKTLFGMAFSGGKIFTIL